MPLVPPPRPAAGGATPPLATVGNAPEWSIGDLSQALKRTLEDAFGHVRLRGEISGYRGPHGSGHAYFSLKDASAKIDAVVWKGVLARLRQKPKEGLEVVVTGRVTTFAGKSSYQIIVETMEPAGVGAWMALLDERRRAFAAEGLFAPEAKRPLPYLPGIIGVVTSPTGAVIRDILHRLADRFPRPVLVWPVRVQGEGAAEEVAAAIRGFDGLVPGGTPPRPDVLIVARGGGSIEDLWAFNEECVVRAVAACTLPVIAAVGHETDVTLIDLVADRRAPTPTGAAEMAVPVRADLEATVAELGRRGHDALARGLDRQRADLRAAARALPAADALLASERQRLDLAEARLAPALAANARDHRQRLNQVLERLARHSPELALSRARERLARIDDRPRSALVNYARRKDGELGFLARRLVVARAATVERAQAVQARRADRLAALESSLCQTGARLVERRRDRLDGLGGLLGSLSYRAVLERGYALVRAPDGAMLRSAGAAARAPAMVLQFADGTVAARPDPAAPPTEPPPRPRRARASPPREERPAARQGTLFEG